MRHITGRQGHSVSGEDLHTAIALPHSSPTLPIPRVTAQAFHCTRDCLTCCFLQGEEGREGVEEVEEANERLR